ncbi:MAG: VIT1/CCC1 transporter family protein [Spirochaetales bacterium]|nr:VIT1/CCC1 transporter family protein [Spirochaetales bacterium]MCF7938514.1 VIT1/CCC1 transporter family protein [Spirochaetales bacterium]
MNPDIPKTVQRQLLTEQQNELDAYLIYSRLAKRMKQPENAELFHRIAEDEKRHYEFWKSRSEKELRPSRFKIFWFSFISRVFGYTFGLKLLERNEEKAQAAYSGNLVDYCDGTNEIIRDEEEHEHELINMLDEERLDYMGSVVLGLNDALVELTGALAGLSFALQNTRLIALSGLITGIAASMSMAASEYLSTKAEGGKNPGKSSLYTGIAYIFTVFVLVIPYFMFDHYAVCLGVTLAFSVVIIFVFNYYLSVAKDYNFARRFWEMAGISLGVAGLSFLVGILVRQFLPVEL